MLKNIVFFLIFCLLICYPLYAQVPSSDNYRKAEQSDIIGIWKMSFQMAYPQATSKSLFFADFQVFEFSLDNMVKNISSPTDLPMKQIRDQLADMEKRVQYAFIEPGIIEIKRSNKITNSIIISVITKDMQSPVRLKAPVMKKGDLILSYIDGNKQMFMQRFLTKLKYLDALGNGKQQY